MWSEILKCMAFPDYVCSWCCGLASLYLGGEGVIIVNHICRGTPWQFWNNRGKPAPYIERAQCRVELFNLIENFNFSDRKSWSRLSLAWKSVLYVESREMHWGEQSGYLASDAVNATRRMHTKLLPLQLASWCLACREDQGKIQWNPTRRKYVNIWACMYSFDAVGKI